MVASEATKVESGHIIVGKISGVYGVKGWLKVFSYTDPRENILNYNPLLLKQGNEWKEVKLLNGRLQGKGVIVQFAGVTDRDQALAMIDVEIAITQQQLPALSDGEYYWRDLIGLKVINLEGEALGTVDHLFETGANNVLVLKGERERLLPYVMGQVIKDVDLESGQMLVDWCSDD